MYIPFIVYVSTLHSDTIQSKSVYLLINISLYCGVGDGNVIRLAARLRFVLLRILWSKPLTSQMGRTATFFFFKTVTSSSISLCFICFSAPILSSFQCQFVISHTMAEWLSTLSWQWNTILNILRDFVAVSASVYKYKSPLLFDILGNFPCFLSCQELDWYYSHVWMFGMKLPSAVILLCLAGHNILKRMKQLG